MCSLCKCNFSCIKCRGFATAVHNFEICYKKNCRLGERRSLCKCNFSIEMYKKFVETGTRQGGKSLGKYNWDFRRFLQIQLSIDERCILLIVFISVLFKKVILCSTSFHLKRYQRILCNTSNFSKNL